MPRAFLAIGVFVICFVALQVGTALRISATWDEPAHLAAGYAAVAHGDYRIDPAHPPLARMWAAAPLLLFHTVQMDRSPVDAVSGLDWVSNGHAYAFARDFMFTRNDGDRMLFAARMMIVALGLLLGILVFAWTYEWLGFSAAALALGLFVLSPNLTGHASLVTTDLPVTCFSFGTIYFLWRTCRQFATVDAVATAVFFGLAVTTKFSALLLIPSAAALLGLALYRQTLTWRQAGIVAGLAVTITVAAVWAVYGFRYAPAPDGWLLSLETTPALRERAPFTAALAEWSDAHRLLPNAFTQGILLMRASSASNPAYLLGEISTEGWWYYFPLAFLIKTPIAKLALVGGGLWLCIRSTRAWRLSPCTFIIGPAAVFIALAMASGYNIGMRHILPALPFTLLLATAAASALAVKRSTAARLALVVLLVGVTAEYARAYPHPLTFFNQFVGGPENGYRYLSDSNLGWGQQLKTLKRWMDDNEVSDINLAYFGQVDPEHYGINHVLLPGSSLSNLNNMERPRLPGYVAFSGTVLTGVYLHPAWRLFYRPFFEMAPTAILGNSLRVYWVNDWPVAPLAGGATSADFPAAAALGLALYEGLRWPELASEYLAAAAGLAPDNRTLQALLAQTRRAIPPGP